MAEMTTTTQNYLLPPEDDSFHHFYDDVDKTTYLAIQGTLIALTFLLNVTVIGVIVYLYVKRPNISDRTPHFIPVLACCVAEVLEGVFDSFLLNFYRERGYEEPFGWTCHETLAIELTAFIVEVLPQLLVAAVIVTQAVGLQQIVTLTRLVRKIVAVVLVGLAVLYILVVTVPLFFMTFLKDNKQICRQDPWGEEYLNFQTDENKYKILPAFDYIVPSILNLLACLLLLLAYCVSNNSKNYHDNSAITTATASSLSPRPTVSRPPIPFSSFLAALSCILLKLIFFMYLFGLFSDLRIRSGLWLWGRTSSTEWSCHAAGCSTLTSGPCGVAVETGHVRHRKLSFWRAQRGGERTVAVTRRPELVYELVAQPLLLSQNVLYNESYVYIIFVIRSAVTEAGPEQDSGTGT